MNTNSKITEFIKVVCENLNINVPMVEYKQTLGSQTMLAQCSSDGEKIVLNFSWLKPRDSWELISTEKIFTKLSR